MRASDLTAEARAEAMGPWDREGGRARRGRGTLYRSRALEVVFTLAPPWLPYLVMGPIAVATSRSADWSTPGRVIAAATLGALVWSLVEYAMHRFLFHARVTSEGARAVLLLVHGHHHVWPDDTQRIAATPIQFGSLALLLYGVFSLALPSADAHVAFTGAMLAYLAYEAAHYYAHHGRARTGVLGALRRHHMLHHHDDPRTRWGIGSPLWDLVFRTMGKRA